MGLQPWDMHLIHIWNAESEGTYLRLIDPSLTEDENREFIVEQIIEKEDLMWDIEDIDWEVITP